ncbi:hypothetical protein [Streptomyces sp. V1I6]|uniref:hypothetical protein n=1 Tax=Streptomyces sp. V1I6 TaxID=3042273 RepID=UPI002783E547|nr:hypothetical protein [Streptomyces sp. V1I6]MDQ0847701.1 hypothetical protein [Streptomyces sp. V1I6]
MESVSSRDAAGLSPWWQAPEEGDLDFPPILNGVDYLSSVVNLLSTDSNVSARDLKYAVLHLQAATEVLLKALLLREHWSLVFKDVGQASQGKYEDGDFESCGIDETVQRLRSIAGLSITDKEHKALRALAKDRNALQHFGLKHNARAVEARAGGVLDFLIRILDEELLPSLSNEEERAIDRDMRYVRSGLTSIRSFVTQRMNRASGALKGNESRTVQCFNCEQFALLVGFGENRCHFCGMVQEASSTLTLLYVRINFELDQSIYTCPHCDEPTVVRGVTLADQTTVSFCFTCATDIPIPSE